MKSSPIYLLLLGIIIMALVLVSGELTINHKLKPDLQPVPESTIDCSKIVKTCDIQLATGIYAPEEYYHIGKKLRTIDSSYTVRLHLSGYGGQVKGMRYLTSILKQTNAHVVSIVEGDVYSAHAHLAVAFDELRVIGDYNMLFHSNSHYQEAFNLCIKHFFRGMLKPSTNYKTGELVIRETRKEYLEKALKHISIVQETDRGMPAFKKCVRVYTELSNRTQAASAVEFSKFMTEQEMFRYNAGDDVIIPALEILRRLSK